MSKLTATFDHATGLLRWCITRPGVEPRAGEFATAHGQRDPLVELRHLELRSALRVELPGADLTAGERNYALACGWTLTEPKPALVSAP